MADYSPKKNRKKKYSNNKIDDSLFQILIFGISILFLFLIIIPGENIWLWLHDFIFGLFGICSILLPIFSISLIILKALNKTDNYSKLKIVMCSLTILLSCSLFYIFSDLSEIMAQKNWFFHVIDEYKLGNLNGSSGLFGGLLGSFFVWAFGSAGAKVTSIIFLFICIMILTSMTLSKLLDAFSKPAVAIKEKIENTNFDLFKNRRNSEIDISIGESRKQKKSKSNKNDFDLDIISKPENENFSKNTTIQDDADEISKVTEKFISKIKNEDKEEIIEISSGKSKNKKEVEDTFEVPQESTSYSEYKFPSIDLLDKSDAPNKSDISAELNHNGKMLVDILKSFNVQTKIVDISRGPAVTRYELQPASGVKISKITTLSDDIALNLASTGVRIEAPIPGKAAVGVEIPNKVVSIVKMRELIASQKFKSSKSKLTVVLGRDISGEIMTADLAKMPHLLIAGSTGSGKSVCINSFIISILYNASPDEVKLLMIDPKVVELGIYNGIPHLLVPVVTDPKKAAGALNWAVNEMLNRYKKFAENNVRDLNSYNDFVSRHPTATDKNGEVLEKMPQIVIIIDELSDLMMAAPNEIEDYICRLAQMARAAGMYLVIATQRPSVDVITGIIKANIPSRIALAVSSQIDSRTILDMSGAEKLLGRGDMLFSPVGAPKPIRVQGCFVTDREIENIIESIKESKESNYDLKIAEEIEKNAISENSKSKDSSQNDSSTDPMMDEAIKCVVEAGQASTSLLQRRLRVGYARAGRLVDEMEQMGIVGPHEGSKARQVLINYQQYMEMKMNKKDGSSSEGK